MLSMPHLIVLFLIALVVFGPEKLPELARMLGKVTAEVRKMTSDFRYALEDEVRELDRKARIQEQEIALNSAKPDAGTPHTEGPPQTFSELNDQESGDSTTLAESGQEVEKAHVAKPPDEKAPDDNPAT